MLPISPEESIRLLSSWGGFLLTVGPTGSECQNMYVIALDSHFTAEPVEEPLNFWMNELETPCVVKFSPYNQVFQRLQEPAGILSKNPGGLNVVLLGWKTVSEI